MITIWAFSVGYEGYLWVCEFLTYLEAVGQGRPVNFGGHVRSGPEPQLLTPETLSSGLVPNAPSPTPYVPPTKKDWEILFPPMFDEYFNPPPSVAFLVPVVVAPVAANLTGSPYSTTIDQDAPSTKLNSKESSSRDVIPTNVHSVNQPPEHL
ncbi:hypothetical protein Tco_0873623 [Tanacetum coccineum]|uniref:Uncharacterized protein n=1 Tax=Tanacetum coccineum TaxID=301880 RepID=A0ABQ5BM77_9ASTR